MSKAFETIGASSSDIARAAQVEVQPFFRAHIHPLHHGDDLTELRRRLASALDSALASTSNGSSRYIFYKEKPRIYRRSGRQGDCHSGREQTWPPHLLLELDTGGANEDEFALIHFLRSQQQEGGTLHRCAIHVEDEDGEFLLIEGADHLPDWIDPDNASGRVWLLGGSLCLITPELYEGSHSEAEVCGPIGSVDFALQLLNDSGAQLYHSKELNDAAFARLRIDPRTGWIAESQHQTTIFVPSHRVAAAFCSYPQLIARAGQAFLGRDSQDMRVASKMARLMPSRSSGTTGSGVQGESLCIAVSLPRRLYTHLLSARFTPPKVFPEQYKDAVMSFWQVMDALTAVTEGESGQRPQQSQSQAHKLAQGRRWDLGCKLSVGLEVALDVDSRRRVALARPSPRRADIFAAAAPRPEMAHKASEGKSGHEEMFQRLEKLGYFEGEMRGSRRWNELAQSAIDTLGESKANEALNPSYHGRDEMEEADERAATEESSLWTQDESIFGPAPVSKSIPLLDPADIEALQSHEEPDSWLYEVGESFLEDGEGVGGPHSEEREAQEKLGHFARQVETFIEGKGDVEGAILDETDSDSSDVEDNDSDAQAVARSQIAQLSLSEREEKLQALLPNLGHSIKWDPSGNHDQIAQDLLALASNKTLDSRDAMVVDRGETKAPVPAPQQAPDRTQKAKPTPPALSNEELRRSLAASAKAMRSSHLGQSNFDGAENWQADEDDDEADDSSLDENGQRETKEVRRARARMLDIEPSDSESDEIEDGTASGKTAKANDPKHLNDDVEDEMAEFLDFARQELGLSGDQLRRILDERKQSGRWTPGSAGTNGLASRENPEAFEADPVGNHLVGASPSEVPQQTAEKAQSFAQGLRKGFLTSKRSSGVISAPAEEQAPKAQPYYGKDGESRAKKQKKVSFSVPSAGQGEGAASGNGKTTAPGDNGFNDLMAAMDARLNEHRIAKGLPPLSSEELESGEIRSEDWALRRPGGASLGSVWMRQKETEQKDRGSSSSEGDGGKAQEEDIMSGSRSRGQLHTPNNNAVDTHGQDEDEDEDDENAPLSARDPALLERLLQEEVPRQPDFKATLERIARERNWQQHEGERPRPDSSSNTSEERVRLGDPPPYRIVELSGDADAGVGGESVYDGMPMLEDASDDDDDDDDEEMPVAHSRSTMPQESKTAAVEQKRGAQGASMSELSSEESEESDEEMFPTIVPSGAEEAESLSNLMASWQAQGGRPGPMGNLIKGLGIKGQAPR